MKIVSVKAVKGGMFQLQLAETISPAALGRTRPQDQINSFIGEIFEGDERFNQARPTFAWQNVPKDVAEAILGETLELALGESKEVDVENPMFNEKYLRVMIVERVEGDSRITKWQLQNKERAAKRAGADGAYLTKEGKLIFRTTHMISTPGADDAVKHILVDHDGTLESVSAPAPQTLPDEEVSL